MGMSLMHSSGVWETGTTGNNPDPSRFVVEATKGIGTFCIALVRYPNCTNFEGLKLLVFARTHPDAVKEWKRIDPHFAQGSLSSPLARFEPTTRGLAAAVAMCSVLVEEEE
jgi:hypothetical protein